MKYSVKTFGIASDILGGKNVTLETTAKTVGELRQYLSSRYPDLDELRSLFIAINQHYADDITELKETDEIAIIPPVSGG